MTSVQAVIFETEDELMNFIPPGSVLGRSEHDPAFEAVLQCGPEPGLSSWIGHLEALVDESVDRPGVLEDVAAEWLERDDWTVERARDVDPIVVLRHDDGFEIGVQFSEDGERFKIQSMSGCVPD